MGDVNGQTRHSVNTLCKVHVRFLKMGSRWRCWLRLSFSFALNTTNYSDLEGRLVGALSGKLGAMNAHEVLFLCLPVELASANAT